MIKEIFNALKEKLKEKYPDYKFALGGLIERLPYPENQDKINQILPLFVLQPKTSTIVGFDITQQIVKEIVNLNLFLIKRWTGEPEDLDENYNILESLKPVVKGLKGLKLENGEIKDVESLLINFEPDIELFFRTGFINLTGISLEFNVVVLKKI